MELFKSYDFTIPHALRNCAEPFVEDLYELWDDSSCEIEGELLIGIEGNLELYFYSDGQKLGATVYKNGRCVAPEEYDTVTFKDLRALEFLKAMLFNPADKPVLLEDWLFALSRCDVTSQEGAYARVCRIRKVLRQKGLI